MNIISISDLSAGEYRVVGEGFTATAVRHFSYRPAKKTRIHRSEETRHAAEADLLAKKGLAEPVYPTRPEGVEAWDGTEAGNAFRDALDAAQDATIKFFAAVRRFEKPRVFAALAALGVPVESLSWNRKAGCSCGCSPAYVAPKALTFTAMTFPKYGEPVEREFAITALFLK